MRLSRRGPGGSPPPRYLPGLESASTAAAPGAVRRADTVSNAHIAPTRTVTAPSSVHAGMSALTAYRASSAAAVTSFSQPDRADHPQPERDVADEVERDAAAEGEARRVAERLADVVDGELARRRRR